MRKRGRCRVKPPSVRDNGLPYFLVSRVTLSDRERYDSGEERG
jgi:hypothetical protein